MGKAGGAGRASSTESFAGVFQEDTLSLKETNQWSCIDHKPPLHGSAVWSVQLLMEAEHMESGETQFSLVKSQDLV